MKEKGFLIVVLALCFACSVRSQIYGGEVCFYIKAGQDLTESTNIQIVKFDGRTVKVTSDRLSIISERLSRASDFYDDYFLNHRLSWDYNSSLSTSSRVVYQSEWTGDMKYVQTGQFTFEWVAPQIGMYYRAFSKDKSSMISWKERKNSSSILDKTYYKRLDKKDLKPKSVNRDFLYE